MKILEVKTLALPEVKVIRFARFKDQRGYFTETYRRSDFKKNVQTDFLKGVEFTQGNESYSKKGVIRGLHFQWNPNMGKLIRTLWGRMIDLVLDIRKGSPNFGRIIAYDMPSNPERDFDEWIWVPVGFAHGNCFLEETSIEYFCTGQYNPKGEAGISPLSSDIDWFLADKKLTEVFQKIKERALMSEKDKKGLTVKEWLNDPRSKHFIYRPVAQ